MVFVFVYFWDVNDAHSSGGGGNVLKIGRENSGAWRGN